jgi:hypothetical protein
MEWADFPGIFGGSTTNVALSSDDEEWHALLVALHKTFNTQPFTTKDLVGQLGDHDRWTGGTIDPAVLPGDLADRWAHVRDGPRRESQTEPRPLAEKQARPIRGGLGPRLRPSGHT